MAFWNFVIYRKSDFASLDFDTGATTNATINPIYITVEDDDTRLEQQGSDGPFYQTITASSDPSLVGQNIFHQVFGPQDQIFDTSSGTLILHEIRIGSLTDWVIATLDDVNTTLDPSTTYNDDLPINAKFNIYYADGALPCFTNGTLIAVPGGGVPVERLAVGDLVTMLDNGPQRIHWIGRRDLTCEDLLSDPRLSPIRIACGAMSHGLPRRKLMVSRQHRMLACSDITWRMFDADQVLLPAVKLSGLPGVTVQSVFSALSYYHILCDRHELLLAEGCPAESLYVGQAMCDAAAAEAFGLSPNLPVGNFARRPAPDPYRWQARQTPDRAACEKRETFASNVHVAHPRSCSIGPDKSWKCHKS